MRYHDRLFARSPGARHKGVLPPKASKAVMQMVMRPSQRNCCFACMGKKGNATARSNTWRREPESCKPSLAHGRGPGESAAGTPKPDRQGSGRCPARKFAGSNARRPPTEANTMTNKEYLEMELQLSVQKFGEEDPVTLGTKRQLREIEERSGAATLESPTASEFLQFQAGFRRAKQPKKFFARTFTGLGIRWRVYPHEARCRIHRRQKGHRMSPYGTRPATITNRYCGQDTLQAGLRMTSEILARKRSTKQTEQFSVFVPPTLLPAWRRRWQPVSRKGVSHLLLS